MNSFTIIFQPFWEQVQDSYFAEYISVATSESINRKNYRSAVNYRLSALGTISQSITRSINQYICSDLNTKIKLRAYLNKPPVLRKKFLMSAQVRLSTELKLGANLNKRKRIFVINLRKNFEKNFMIFMVNLLAWNFLLFFIFYNFNNQLDFNNQVPIQNF